MRPLKRPMFKYGGDVKKQGIMHGMNGLRDGGVATTMADATGYAGGGMTMPNMRGRVTGPGGYAGEKNIFGMGVAKNPDGTPVTIPRRNFFEDASFVLNPFTKLKVASMMGKAGIRGGKEAISSGIGSLKNFFKGPVPARKAGEVKNRLVTTEKAPFLSDKFFGQYIKGPLQSTKKAFTDAFGPAAGSIKDYKTAVGLGVPATGFGAYKMYQGFKDRQKPENKKDGDDKILTEEQKQIKALQDQIAAMNKKKTITGKPEPTEEDKLKRIYSLLGVDRAQRGAASKALADMSRYIDEGGKDTISRKNIGSTLTKGILAFDKRLDKVDQLKEAAGLMMAKGEIEAMSNPLAKEVQRTTIDVNRAKLDQAKDASTIKAKFQSTTGGGLTSPQAAKATAQYLYKNKYVGDIVDDDTFAELIKNNSKKGKSERETIVSVISGIAKKQTKPNGIYTAGDVIFEITDQEVSKIIVG